MVQVKFKINNERFKAKAHNMHGSAYLYQYNPTQRKWNRLESVPCEGKKHLHRDSLLEWARNKAKWYLEED